MNSSGLIASLRRPAASQKSRSSGSRSTLSHPAKTWSTRIAHVR
jgi:hypothetical protein